MFSRRINSQSLFRFTIDEASIGRMSSLEQIAETLRRDRLSLRIFKLILEEGAQTPEDIAKAYRNKIPLDDYLKKRFESVSQQIASVGALNYRELLREFEGKGIIDPIVNGRLDLAHPKVRGEQPQEYNDFGFVSIAKHPFVDNDEFLVVYSAGRHGPGTSHSVRFLSQHEMWAKRPLGGVFEVQMETSESYRTKFQEVAMIWDTDEYDHKSFGTFSAQTLKTEPALSSSVFISAPYRKNDSARHESVNWMASTVEEYYQESGNPAKCFHPYDLFFKGEWNFVNGILKHFPPARLILHDITDYSPGVMFEVGCSMGLNKRFELFWNTSQSAFDSEHVPQLLRFTHVRELALQDRERSRQEIRNVLAALSKNDSLGSRVCPGHPKRKRNVPCPYESNHASPEQMSDKVFVVVNDRHHELIEHVVSEIRRHGRQASLPKDLPDEYVVCRICRGLASCQAAVIDVSNGDLDGLLALGMARSREKRAIQFYYEGSHGSSMFDGHSQVWRKESIAQDVANGIDQVLSGFGKEHKR